MAARWEDDLQGYDVNRFEDEVRPDLLCTICQDVPKSPRLCQNKDHIFCFDHISQHLRQNSHTCPICRDPLTPGTLRRPAGFLKSYLEDLKIKCDHHDRGCPDVIRLEDLQRHVDQCGFAPVMCGNEGCGAVVNGRDQRIHERDLCKFRVAKCHDCRDIKASQDEMKASQDEMKASQDEIKIHITRTEDEIKGKVDEIKQTQKEMKADQMAFEFEVRTQFDKMTEMLNQLLQRANNQDIIIIGGWYGQGDEQVLNTVENFNIVEGKSTQLLQLNYPRANSASCVYNGDVIIAGGYDGQGTTDTIEILKINQNPLRWMMFAGKLPVRLSGHDVVVYNGKLYVVGGYNWNERRRSDTVYELSLIPPYIAKPLARMSQPRLDHRAAIVNRKLYILGGTTTGNSNDAVDSVIVYDFINNDFKPLAPLPKPVCVMSTVTWGNMIIVIGGVGKYNQVLNDVIMYDTETGRSQELPPLIHKRCGSSAVIMDDVIVVVGGWNEVEGRLNSVESFTMSDDNGWRELPGMKEKRYRATAVAKPGN